MRRSSDLLASHVGVGVTCEPSHGHGNFVMEDSHDAAQTNHLNGGEHIPEITLENVSC